ncbi:MAG: DUF1295 domain-containing protein, partial [Chthoniobacterales bacterium]
MMNESFWSLSMLGLTLAMSIMALVWLLARVINNASIVDIAWSLGFTPIVLALAVFGTGAPERRYLLAAMVCVWSLRLGSYIWVRVAKHHPEEDGRYAEL